MVDARDIVGDPRDVDTALTDAHGDDVDRGRVVVRDGEHDGAHRATDTSVDREDRTDLDARRRERHAVTAERTPQRTVG